MASVSAASSSAVSSSVPSFLNGFSVLLNHVPIVVPQADRRFRQVVFVAQDAQRRRGEHEEAGPIGRQAPAAPPPGPPEGAVAEHKGGPRPRAPDGHQPSGYGTR